MDPLPGYLINSGYLNLAWSLLLIFVLGAQLAKAQNIVPVESVPTSECLLPAGVLKEAPNPLAVGHGSPHAALDTKGNLWFGIVGHRSGLVSVGQEAKRFYVFTLGGNPRVCTLQSDWPADISGENAVFLTPNDSQIILSGDVIRLVVAGASKRSVVLPAPQAKQLTTYRIVQSPSRRFVAALLYSQPLNSIQLYDAETLRLLTACSVSSSKRDSLYLYTLDNAGIAITLKDEWPYQIERGPVCGDFESFWQINQRPEHILAAQQVFVALPDTVSSRADGGANGVTQPLPHGFSTAEFGVSAISGDGNVVGIVLERAPKRIGLFGGKVYSSDRVFAIFKGQQLNAVGEISLALQENQRPEPITSLDGSSIVVLGTREVQFYQLK